MVDMQISSRKSRFARQISEKAGFLPFFPCFVPLTVRDCKKNVNQSILILTRVISRQPNFADREFREFTRVSRYFGGFNDDNPPLMMRIERQLNCHQPHEVCKISWNSEKAWFSRSNSRFIRGNREKSAVFGNFLFFSNFLEKKNFFDENFFKKIIFFLKKYFKNLYFFLNRN